MLDVNLSGVWRTCKVTAPHLIARGAGSVILVSSIAGMRGLVGVAHYTAAKHGVVGLMRTLANELAPHGIRVNSVHPTNVDTPMIQNEAVSSAFRPDLDRAPDQGRVRRGCPDDEHARRSVGRTARRRKCLSVPGFRRSSLHHRGHAARRRGEHPEVDARQFHRGARVRKPSTAPRTPSFASIIAQWPQLGKTCSSAFGMVRIGSSAMSRGLTRSSRPHVNNVGSCHLMHLRPRHRHVGHLHHRHHLGECRLAVHPAGGSQRLGIGR